MDGKEQFRFDCLKAHNEYRKCHGANPVELDKTLNEYAQKWADHMAATSKFEHSETNYGENIACTKSSKASDGPTGKMI